MHTEHSSKGGPVAVQDRRAPGDIVTTVSFHVLSAVIVSLLAVSTLLVNIAQAVPANPEGVEVIQPDGTKIKVFLRGDENAHWTESEEGYLVTKDEDTGVWHYVMHPLSFTAFSAVGATDPQAIGAVLPDMDAISAQVDSVRQERMTATSEVPLTPSTGTMRNLVVLVSFSDMAVDYPRQSYDYLFNQIGYNDDGAAGSVKDYYHEISYNTFTVESTVVEAVTLDNGYAYYGANDASDNDIRPREMVAQALAKLEARGFDFSTMDGDGDGWIDGLTIIHAGGGEEYGGNPSNYIWSHQWSLSSPVTYDGVSMQTYHTEPARRGWDNNTSTQGITRIGVICHENGHFLELPDLYDYGYDSEGAGTFCLMASGSWNGDDGTTPAHMSAWCRSKLGWATPTVISTAGPYSLVQVETSGQIYKLRGPFPSTQYFLVENRQGVGFDTALPGSVRGILIWHIDETRTNNNDQAHYMVDLEEASGTQHLATNANSGNDADYFRAGNATMFTANTVPNNLSYSGVAIGLNITGVGVSGANMSFAVVPGPTITSITPNIGNAGSPVNITDLAGTGFVSGATVKLTQSGQSDMVATSVVVVSATQITCTFTIRSSASGQWNVIVTNPDTQSTILANGFAVLAPAPVISSITPNTGIAGNTVSITNLAGAAFASGAGVKLTRTGKTDIVATSVVVVSAARITCTLTLPTTSVGVWNVVVTNMDGQSSVLAGAFTVISPNTPPQLTGIAVTPTSGTVFDQYYFSVHYYDVEGDVPVSGTGTLSFHGASDMQVLMSLESGTPANGTYSCTVTLGSGAHGFRITFADTAEIVTTTPWQDGPYVDLRSRTNDDSIVNFLDFVGLASNWMSSGCGTGNAWCGRADIDRSGQVDTGDLMLVAGEWMMHPVGGGSKFFIVPGGQFDMGDKADVANAAELPVHRVFLDTYSIGRYEITNSEYCQALNWAKDKDLFTVVNGVVTGIGNNQPYCDTTASSSYSRIVWDGISFSITAGKENHPMVMVYWMGAAAYCNWRSEMEQRQPCYNLTTWDCNSANQGYCLPTEAQWECAARGGLEGMRYPWGNSIVASQVNYSGSGDPYQVSPYPYTTPAGFYDGQLHNKTDFGWPAAASTYQTTSGINGYTMYDVAGNVFELCNDWYSSSYYSTRPNPDVNPTGPETGTGRVTRGGSWNTSTNYCRVSWRDATPPTMRAHSIGFRIVLSGGGF